MKRLGKWDKAEVGASSAYPGRRNTMQAGTRARMMICILGVTLLTGRVFADTITWNVGGGVGGIWDTTTANWTGDPGGRNDNLYADGDAVTFDDTGAGGTINLTANRAPASTTVAGGALYTFIGSGITNGPLLKSGTGTNVLNNTANGFSSITLAGGELQWSDTGRLGTGVIYVTSNSTLRSTKTSGPAYMNNAAIVVSDGVTLDLWQQNPNNIDTSYATVAPISGGSADNPITVNLRHTVSQGRVRLSPSDFIGTIYLRNRMIFEGFNDNQFGHPDNTLYIVGGFETYDMPEIQRPVIMEGGYPALAGVVFNGVVTNTWAAQVVGAVRFNHPASTIGTLLVNGGTVEFGFLPTDGSMRSDSGGSIGVVIRFLGDLVGNADFRITKGYAFDDGAANNRWIYLDVPSPNADVTLTQPVSGSHAHLGGFRKDGSGTLTLAHNANNNFGALQVRGGRLNVTGTLNGVSNSLVQSGATLGGTGTLNLGASFTTLTFTNGATLSPGVGAGIGTLAVNNGTTLLSESVTYTWDINDTTNDCLAAASLDFGSLTNGHLKIRIAAGTTRRLKASDRFTLFSYTGTVSGFNDGVWSFSLEQTGSDYLLTNPQVAQDPDAKTIYLTGLASKPQGTVMLIK